MLRAIALRLAGVLPVLFLVTLVLFVLLRLAPGDAADLLVPDEATEEEVARIRERWGLDRPILEQYARFLDQCGEARLRPLLPLRPGRLPAHPRAAAGDHRAFADGAYPRRADRHSARHPGGAAQGHAHRRRGVGGGDHRREHADLLARHPAGAVPVGGAQPAAVCRPPPLRHRGAACDRPLSCRCGARRPLRPARADRELSSRCPR